LVRVRNEVDRSEGLVQPPPPVPTLPSDALLAAEGLRHAYGGREVVRGVSLSLAAGRATALVGESGSGKSTLARLLLRLERPTAGRLQLRGRELLEAGAREPLTAYWRDVQMVFQDPFASLNPMHTVRHHVERPLVIHGRARTARERDAGVRRLLSLVGLEPVERFIDAVPSALSGGQRQRVAIARALAPEPAVLVADEPTSMLDASIRSGVLSLFDRLVRQERLALLLVTHDLASARMVCDEALVLFSGVVVEQGPIEAVLAAPAHPYTAALLAALPRADVRRTEPVGAHAATSRAGASTGCRYAPRCPSAQPDCTAGEPPLVALRGAPGRFVRCLHPLEQVRRSGS